MVFHLSSTAVSQYETDIDLTGRFELERAVRILCYVNTIPETYENKARHVMNTWARQCTKVIFISSEDSTELPVINLNLTFKENRKHLWRKMQSALLYLYGFRNDYDFFFKADDDTYATVDNLRYALKDLNPDEPIISGYPFTHIIKSGHLSGGAGYVLSRATLKLLVEKALNKHPECPTFDEDLEDVKISMCAYAVGARFVPLVDRHSTIPYHVDDLHQNEYRFQWMDLKSLFDWELPYKKAALTDSVHSTVPFIRDDHEYGLWQVKLVPYMDQHLGRKKSKKTNLKNNISL
ncbi:unnamed protein product [Echinostoma caproni]|uniref:N-acetylgalactosaminide beta-1,3-galactosyltransferase n=1 Tax=Echinostoma caproni TaxID=27848 RepID=A0A183AQG1_9TREM|nr:unnamed protein product [Echinostoma caproni]